MRMSHINSVSVNDLSLDFFFFNYYYLLISIFSEQGLTGRIDSAYFIKASCVNAGSINPAGPATKSFIPQWWGCVPQGNMRELAGESLGQQGPTNNGKVWYIFLSVWAQREWSEASFSGASTQ